MNEHVHEWEWIYRPDGVGPRYIGCQCGEAMASDEQFRRIKATERLSAERVKNILKDRKLYSQDVLALHEYANTLEEKP